MLSNVGVAIVDRHLLETVEAADSHRNRCRRAGRMVTATGTVVSRAKDHVAAIATGTAEGAPISKSPHGHRNRHKFEPKKK